MSEHDDQCAVIEWVGWNETRLPDLKLLHASANGGLRNKVVAGKLKKSGVKAGVPDLCLPVPKGKYCGLYIEMKYGRKTPSEAQERWIDQLRMVGHRVEVCYGAGEAIDVLNGYLGGKG